MYQPGMFVWHVDAFRKLEVVAVEGHGILELVQAYEPGSKLLVLGMVIQPLIGILIMGYINPYYWVDDHPLLYGNNESLDLGTYRIYDLLHRLNIQIVNQLFPRNST